MIDEVLEVKKYLAGEPPREKKRLYRACYMIAKYLKEDGKSPVDTVSFIHDWAKGETWTTVNLLQCVNAAYMNDTKLRRGRRVFVSDADVQAIMEHAPTDTDRKVALAMLCNAKAFANKKGVFQASTEAIGSWIGLSGANIRNRNIKRLCEWRYIEKVDTDRGKGSGRFTKYNREQSCFRMLVPFSGNDGEELVDNDIGALYTKLFAGKGSGQDC